MKSINKTIFLALFISLLSSSISAKENLKTKIIKKENIIKVKSKGLSTTAKITISPAMTLIGAVSLKYGLENEGIFLIIFGGMTTAGGLALFTSGLFNLLTNN